jgi:hypothetical protein
MVVLSVGEAADRAGRDKRTIRRWLEGGKIPGAVRSATQPNQPWRIPQTGLDAYLAAIDEEPVVPAPPQPAGEATGGPGAASATPARTVSDNRAGGAGSPADTPALAAQSQFVPEADTPEQSAGLDPHGAGQGGSSPVALGSGATPVPPAEVAAPEAAGPASAGVPSGVVAEALRAAARAEGRDELRGELDEARSRVADLQVELEGSRRDIAAAAATEKRLTAERDGARRDLEQARAEQQRMAVDLEKLSERAKVIQSSHDNTIAAHSAELERLVALHAETRHDLEVARAEAKQAQEKRRPWYRRS